MKRQISLFLAAVLAMTIFGAVNLPVSANGGSADMVFNFTTTVEGGGIIDLNDGSVPLYSQSTGYGFVGSSGAMPDRTVRTGAIQAAANGYTITETTETTAIEYSSDNHYNNGGLIFRVDVGKLGGAGAYHVKVVTTSGPDICTVAPTGMQASRLTSKSAWDSAKLVQRSNYAVWDGNAWEYDFAAGQDFINVEVEPKTPAGGTVGISRLEITRLDSNAKSGKPTVFLLSDSTCKSYTFQEAGMSGWGQTFARLFDLDRVNVVNYSTGGRSFKAMYTEGRFNDVLMTGKTGDYVLLQSGHNDEQRDDLEKNPQSGYSGGPDARFGRGSTAETYRKWIEEYYIPAIRARGMIPILVSPMTRINAGKTTGNQVVFAGFKNDSKVNTDFPGIMKECAERLGVAFADQYNESINYLNSIQGPAAVALFQSIEAGESPGATGKNSYANSHPDNKIDGTHFKEGLSKQWSRIIVQQLNLLQQSSGRDGAETIKDYFSDEVKAVLATPNGGASTNDWSGSVYGEIPDDVRTGEQSYYRNQIEKLVQLGVMEIDSSRSFNPKAEMKINDFISGLCAVWGLDPNSFSKYYNSGSLTREVMAGIVYDAYLLRYGKTEGEWNKPAYMSYNGDDGVPPDVNDPSYDPNTVTQSKGQYYPLARWGALTDTRQISLEYAEKFYEVYNLGLIRSEKGIARGVRVNGLELEPKSVVSREKAAKELWFLWVIGQQNPEVESQVLTIPDGNGRKAVQYQSIDYTPAEYEFSQVDINADTHRLSVSLRFHGQDSPSDQLVVDLYDADGSAKLSSTSYRVSGSGAVEGMDLSVQNGQKVVLYVLKGQDGNARLSVEREAVCAAMVVPAKEYSVTAGAGIKNGTLELKNLDESTSKAKAEALTASDETVMWTPPSSGSVNPGDTLLAGMTVSDQFDSKTTDMTIAGIEFHTRISTPSGKNAAYSNTDKQFTGGSYFIYNPPESGSLKIYAKINTNKKIMIVDSDKQEQVESNTSGQNGYFCVEVTVVRSKTYYFANVGGGSEVYGLSFTPGSPEVSITANAGDRIQITAAPAEGYHTESVSALGADGQPVSLQLNALKTTGVFVMPEMNVSISAVFAEGEAPVKPAAILTPDRSGTGVAVKVRYDQQGILTEYEFVKGVTAVQGEPLMIEAPEGTKVMLWEDTDTMRPMASPGISSLEHEAAETTAPPAGARTD